MSPPWMPFYVADYLADTGHLTYGQHGAYLLLIMHYWRQGGLPQDDKILARIARMNDREWKAARPTIAAFFSTEWKHERIEKELDKSREKSERRAEAGARGGNAKALKSKESVLANATILPEQKPADALASSSQPQSDKTSSDVLERVARKPKAARAKARTAIAPDQQPTLDDARSAHLVGMRGNQMRDEWRRFRDHHIAKGSLMADWSAAWRTWCGNFGKFSQARGSPQRGNALAELAFPDLRGPSDDEYSGEYHTSPSASPSDPSAGGFAGRLSESDRDDASGPLLDFGSARAGWR